MSVNHNSTETTENNNGYRNGIATKFKLPNKHIQKMKGDVLYHLALGTNTHNLEEMFGDVKFVLMGGSANRMKSCAQYMKKLLSIDTELVDLSAKSHRFSMYKVGPVLTVNHGMGIPSISILLSEVIKLMYHAKVKDPIFFRVGTCGGIGLEPGTVVVSNKVVDGLLREVDEIPVLGKLVQRPAKLDQALAQDIKNMSRADDGFKTVNGTTMCALDFYEGQARLDGALCNYTESDKMTFLKKLDAFGVKNIEMEVTSLASFTHSCGIKAAAVNVTLLNRLNTDQVDTPKEILLQWENRPVMIVGRYIQKCLQIN